MSEPWEEWADSYQGRHWEDDEEEAMNDNQVLDLVLEMAARVAELEPELIPDALRHRDVEEVARTAVQVTKANIAARIRALMSGQDETGKGTAA